MPLSLTSVSAALRKVRDCAPLRYPARPSDVGLYLAGSPRAGAIRSKLNQLVERQVAVKVGRRYRLVN